MFADAETSSLTYLTRLAKRRPKARQWLGEALRERLESLSETALRVAIETGDPIGYVLAEELKSGGDDELAAHLAELCRDQPYVDSLPLREVALAAVGRHLDALRAKWPEPDDEQRFALAALLNDHGVRLKVARQLVASHPTQTPHLAHALTGAGREPEKSGQQAGRGWKLGGPEPDPHGSGEKSAPLYYSRNRQSDGPHYAGRRRGGRRESC